MNSLLQELRIARGITQEKMANSLELKLGTYKQYEYGHRETPSEVKIKALKLYAVTDKHISLSEAYKTIEKKENY